MSYDGQVPPEPSITCIWLLSFLFNLEAFWSNFLLTLRLKINIIKTWSRAMESWEFQMGSYSFIHSFNKYRSSTYYLSGTVSGTGDAKMSKCKRLSRDRKSMFKEHKQHQELTLPGGIQKKQACHNRLTQKRTNFQHPTLKISLLKQVGPSKCRLVDEKAGQDKWICSHYKSLVSAKLSVFLQSSTTESRVKKWISSFRGWKKKDPLNLNFIYHKDKKSNYSPHLFSTEWAIHFIYF